MESEFFGHEKGAFTDAKERRIGKFEQADGGTILLDEVGELSSDAQVKLLRVIEDKTIMRLGGSESIHVDVRIIAATNKDLGEAVKNDTFRTDLFYRLNIFTIQIPTLRERLVDIPLLVEHFIEKYNEKLGLSVNAISRETMRCLQDHDWPGNVRDLENAVQSAMILVKEGVIRLEHLPLRVRGFPDVKHDSGLDEMGLEQYMKKIHSGIEKDLILKTLRQCGNNRTVTAEQLQISRKTLFNKMKQYGIDAEEGE